MFQNRKQIEYADVLPFLETTARVYDEFAYDEKTIDGMEYPEVKKILNELSQFIPDCLKKALLVCEFDQDTNRRLWSNRG